MNRFTTRVVVVAAVTATVLIGGSAIQISGAMASSPSPATGVVTGTLQWQGAGKFDQLAKLSGTVRLLGATRHIDVKVGNSGRFEVRVPVGEYQVEAGARAPHAFPMGACSPVGPVLRGQRWGSINVRTGARISTRVLCVTY